MQRFKNFADVHVYLKRLVAEEQSRHDSYSVRRMQTFMNYLGNPQDSYKVIHVAGTSGKTSTCYYLSSLLAASGKKVGLSVSPHITEVSERAQINMRPLDEVEFCKELTQFMNILEESGMTLTVFELFVAFAFWEFAKQRVDYAVIEVGVGGLLDGTNVITRADKICVITDIGFDHTKLLGSTLSEITAQKAGIIQPGNEVFCYRQDNEIMDVLTRTCQEKRARLHQIDSDKALSSKLPLFQRRNWHLAQTVHAFVTARDGLSHLANRQLMQAAQVHIPGRLEVVRLRDKTLILDGAHNPQKLSAMVKSLKQTYPRQSIACLVGFARTKEDKVRDNLAVLLPGISHLIATSFINEQTGRRSTEPALIVEQARSLDFRQAESITNPKDALAELLKRDEPILLITGSFFLLQRLRPLIMDAYD